MIVTSPRHLDIANIPITFFWRSRTMFEKPRGVFEPKRSEGSQYTEGFSNIVLGRQNNVISIIIYCYGLSSLRFKSVRDRAWPNYRSCLDLFRWFARRADFRYNLKRQCFYDVIRTQFQSKSKFYIEITEILKLHPIFVAIRHFRFRITKWPPIRYWMGFETG